MSVILYYSSVSSNVELKKHQQKIQMVLDGKKIVYEKRDVTACDEDKANMKKGAGEKSLPPQLFNGEEYCGDYTAFDNAVEDGQLEEFLKLK